MNYKELQKELRRINYPENQYLFYRSTAIIENIVNNSKDKDILVNMDYYLKQLKKLENPFNFDKTIKSQSGLSKLMSIVAGAESYLEGIEEWLTNTATVPVQ